MSTADLPCIDLSLVTYDSSRWVDLFFSSLTTQRFPLDRINVYIHDNGSRDDTLAKVNEWRDEYSVRFASFNVSTSGNIGFGAGHNINLASGKAVFFLVANVDLEFETDAIVKAVTIARTEALDVACWEFRQKPYEHPKYYNPVTLETTWASSACVMFRREAIETVGGYESQLFMYGEDVELSYRLRDQGYVLRYCPAAVCWHYCYSTPHDFKELQFWGNITANSLLRLRFGSLFQIMSLFVMLPMLSIIPLPARGGRKRLLQTVVAILRKAPYFLRSRKQSPLKFSFDKWDYEESREGAFYEFKKPVDKQPLVSVVIRTYRNREGFLREAVQSILNQTYPNIELVVVEDGSEEVRAFIDSIRKLGRLSDVKYISIGKSGRCKAGNAGLANATGSFLSFLDDDDLLFADHIEVLAHELLSDQGVTAVYSLSYEVKTRLLSLSPLHYSEIGRSILYRQSFSRPMLWYKNFIPIQSILFRRELYEIQGGFDETLDNLEDWHLWIRYSLNSVFRLIEKCTSLYRVPAGSCRAIERQASLDSYYVEVMRKMHDMQVTMSPGQIVDCIKDLGPYIYINETYRLVSRRWPRLGILFRSLIPFCRKFQKRICRLFGRSRAPENDLRRCERK